MKCRHVQKTLLATSGRRKLSGEVTAHVEQCARCRRWHARLKDVDRGVALLAVPSTADVRMRFVKNFLAEPSAPAKRWYDRIPGARWQQALVAAAAVVLLLLVWTGLLNRERQPFARAELPTDPLLARVLQRHAELSTAQSAPQRVETLTALAEDLDVETRNLARVAGTDDLDALAGLFEDVVTKGIVVQAEEIHPDDRPKFLPPIADRLFRTSQSAEQLAQDAPPSAAAPLRRIARTARDANLHLRTRARMDIAIQEPDPVRPLPAAGG